MTLQNGTGQHQLDWWQEVDPTMTFFEHAKNRWNERWQDLGLRHNDFSIQRAFRESLPLRSRDTNGRPYLHPPTNMMFIVRGGNLRTAFPHTTEQLTVPKRYERCERCQNLWDPGRMNECKWCAWPEEGPSTKYSTGINDVVDLEDHVP